MTRSDDAMSPVERDTRWPSPRWLGHLFEPIWQLVRDNVLRCL
ncbi:hypothetical protein WME79_01220 [Sorangium sp. So ce726]